MSGLGRGFVNLFKSWGKGIGNAADKLLLNAEARKAISNEVRSKYKPKIDLARAAENKRADNIKDLGDKVTQSKKDLADAQQKWQEDYANALADAKNQRQKDIDAYEAQLKGYQSALDNANTARQDIVGQLLDQEANYDPYRTIYTDVITGHRYLKNRYTHDYEDLSWIYPTLTPKQQRALQNATNGFGERLIDSSSGTPKVINAFDKNDAYTYGGNNTFDEYVKRAQSPQYSALRDADNNISKADAELKAWKGNNPQPQAWDDVNDSRKFETNYKKTNSVPNEYRFNGKTYGSEPELDKAYQDALKHEEALQNSASNSASKAISDQKAVIARRIQDAKDAKKAKLALGALGVGAGAGALYAGARAIYGSDDTNNTDNIDSTNNTDNIDAYTGEAVLNDRQQIDTGSDPDKAEAKAVLADAAHDTGVEDGNSIRSSDDLGNLIGASTGGHTMEDRLYELIKAMKDPYKADAVANYIYSRHGDDPEVQNLGWRGWLNKYYGDSLRSIMNRDPSGYKGMHISGGL